MDKKFQTSDGSVGAEDRFSQGIVELDALHRLGLKPAHLLAITVIGIFLAEVIAMVIISFLGTMSYVWLVLVDALIMIGIVFPVLYYLSFRPLLSTLSEREHALAELRHLQLELEQRVEQRTADLNQANRSLENEIAERKQAEEQLRYQATLLENVSDAIVATDERFRLTAWNAAAEVMYGWRTEEVLGQNGVELLRTDFITGEPEEMRRAINEKGQWQGEATQLRKDGVRIPVEGGIYCASSCQWRDQGLCKRKPRHHRPQAG